jgi:type IV secretory pathway TraG/TraD family ATPase VirD4
LVEFKKSAKERMRLFNTKPQDHGNVVLGKIQNRFRKPAEVLTEAELNHHVHIVGASGYGKTVLISHIIKQKIEQKQGLLFVDLKGDRDTIEQIHSHAVQANRLEDIQMFHLSDPRSLKYNLIGEGTATQLRDKIMLSLNWSEEFYRNQSSSFLLKLLIGLCYIRNTTKFEFDLNIILKCCSNTDYIVELANQIPSEATKAKTCMEDCYNFLNDKGNYNSLQGLRSQLESLTLSDFGELLVSSLSEGINLFNAINSRKITLIFLDTRRYGETAKVVGKFLLQDLKMTSAKIDAEIPKYERKPFVCIIDEFADLAQEDFIGFLDRARSAKIGIIPVHQEISDLNRISPEFAARLMGNTSTLYAFLQKRPESAELISKMAGTKTAWKETQRYSKFLWWDVPTGEKSLREVEEFHIHPNLIKSLRVGECVCVKKYPSSRAYLVRVQASTGI